MNHPRWKSGKLSTGFITEEFGTRLSADLTDAGRTVMAAVTLVDAGHQARRRADFGPHPAPSGIQLSAVFNDGTRIDGTVAANGDGWTVQINRRAIRVDTAAAPFGLWRGTIDGRTVTAGLRRSPEGLALTWRGMRATVRGLRPEVADLVPILPVASSSSSASKVLCPMPGLVVSIDVAAGDTRR